MSMQEWDAKKYKEAKEAADKQWNEFDYNHLREIADRYEKALKKISRADPTHWPGAFAAVIHEAKEALT